MQEDKAPAHASRHQGPVYAAANVSRLLWPGNSPDLNAIESCWSYLKQLTTRKGAPSMQKTARERGLRHGRSWSNVAFNSGSNVVSGIRRRSFDWREKISTVKAGDGGDCVVAA